MKMTVLRTVLVFAGLAILLTGCFEEDNFLADNIERTGNKYPVVSDLSVVGGQDTFEEGETVRLDLRFWSEGQVASINVYDAFVVDGNEVRGQEQVKSIDPSQAAFSEVTQTDSLIIEYTVPTLPADTTFIDLEIEVENENGLTESNETANNFAIGGFGVTGIKP